MNFEADDQWKVHQLQLERLRLEAAAMETEKTIARFHDAQKRFEDVLEEGNRHFRVNHRRRG
jgi:hypothetical protein